MATSELKRLYNAFDPLEPAKDGEYVDTSEVRGSESLSHFFLRHLALAKDPVDGKRSNAINFVFSGHIGGGKSSELRHLSGQLRRGSEERSRYLPIYLDILDYVDVYDVAPTDILLAIVSEIGDFFRNDKELSVELSSTRANQRLNEIWNLLNSEVQLDGGEINLGAAKVKLSLLRTDAPRREIVRKALEAVPAQFHEEVNSVLHTARLAALQKGYEDVVLIVDSLDRIERSHLHEEKLATFRYLFLDNATLFAELRAHKVLTLPLSFVRAHSQELANRYGQAPFTLPVIKVEDRLHATYPRGYECLRELVRKRVAPSARDAVIQPDALDHLIRYSGGHPRLFTRFMNEALAQTNGLPVNLDAAKRAIRPTIRTLVPSVHEGWWRILAELELSSKQQVAEEDVAVQRMLDLTMILEYLNGDEDEIEVEENTPWYAVHPILRDYSGFKDAVAALKDERAKANDA